MQHNSAGEKFQAAMQSGKMVKFGAENAVYGEL